MPTPIVLCCLLWVTDGNAAALSAYEDGVLGLLGDHGASILERVVCDGRDGTPHETQLYEFPGQASLDAYLADPRRAGMSDERDRVVERTVLFPVERRGGTAKLT